MNPLLLTQLSVFRNVSLERATSLRGCARAKEEAELQWMSQALQELDVAHEELRVVEEELHTQTDELSAAYGALEFERRRYVDLFQHAPAPYIVTDVAGIVLEANRLACQLLNIASHFVIGKPLSLFVAGEDRPHARDLFRLLSASAELSTFELRLQPRGATHAITTTAAVLRSRAQGQTLPLRWILYPRAAEGGNASSPHRDSVVSSQVAEEKVLSHERELALERSGRLDAERELKRRNEQLAFVAHEMRNPLSVAAGSLELLNQDAAGLASRQHVLGILNRSVKTLSRLVEDLVDQTRVVKGLVVLECQDTDFRELLQRISDDALGGARAKRVQFTSEIDTSVGSVRCDPHRIQQVLSNVLSNAIKFTPDSGTVQLTAKLCDAEIECVVGDTGPGIAREHLTTIFDPFIRVDAHGASAGLGLGLHIARKLIELHGGTITVESEGVGKGSTFRIRIPVFRAEPPRD
jgi:PAS domain S-box-containing protein